MLDNLNAEQLAAVTLPEESALIVAGAGSGKTHILIARIAYLLIERHIDPSSIMAVTFSNQAAKAMIDRLRSMLPSSIPMQDIWIGTIHSICHRFLRIHSKDAGLTSYFQVIDSYDQISLIKRLLQSKNIKDKNVFKDQLRFINYCKQNGCRASLINPNNEHEELLLAQYKLYEEECQEQGLVDFDELLLRCIELFSASSEVSQSLVSRYRKRFLYIFVDEFQDTNRLQYTWLKLFAGKENVVFAVGDDDQSIYSFRGAKSENMFDFQREFSIKHLIKLEKNYRSYANILHAANALIENNSLRFGKKLDTDRVAGEPIYVFEGLNEYEEAQWIAKEIRRLVQAGKVSLSNIAILSRTRALFKVFEEELAKEKIAYSVHGGMHFFARKEIKDALAYLRLLVNPCDENAFFLIANRPVRKIGPVRMKQLREASKSYSCSISSAVNYLTGTTRIVFKQFFDLLEQWRSETESLSLQDTISYLILNTGLLALYQNEPNAQKYIENLNELVQVAAAFSLDPIVVDNTLNQKSFQDGSDLSATSNLVFSDNGFNSSRNDQHRTQIISNFLSYASLGVGDDAQGSKDNNTVRLMTVHAAKGLAFHTVFIVGLEEGIFPHGKSKNEEEERRLMYVAITRARERLYLSFAQSRTSHNRTVFYSIAKSRFLNELPKNILEWVCPRNGSLSKKLDAYRLGQAVKHSKFGAGTIVQFEGEGKDRRARVHFYNSGNKWLLLAVAKLELCEATANI